MTSVPNSGSSPPPPPVWSTQPTGTTFLGYGGFWIRVVAYIIDAIILTIVLGILGAIFGLSFSAVDIEHYDPTAASPMVGWLYLVMFIVWWLYFALFESSERGATPGKMAMGLRVVTGDGKRLSFLNATGRYFAKIVSAIILYIGFIMIGFTQYKRGLHDMMANTLVIKVR
jgi:uncharacterized RDD family membrane protein YckC